MASISLFSASWTSILGTLLFGFIATTCAFFWAFLHLTQDSREPPLAPCIIPIPYLGPVIEMRWKKSRFPLYMKSKFPDPIYTVRVPGKRFYFVNSRALIPLIQRHFRTLSFDPPLIQGVQSILGVSPTTIDIMNHGLAPGADNTFLGRLNKAVHSSLSAGPVLDNMTRQALQVLERSLTNFAASGPKVVNMYDWVRKTVMIATTDSVFGPRNPFRDPVNIAAWIHFETQGMPLLALDVLPDWMIRDGIAARETLVTALSHYLAENGQAEASEFMQRRITFYLQEGVPIEDISRLAVADNIAFSSNLIPTEFWLLYHVFSDPVVLKDCRAEVEKSVQHHQNSTHTVDLDFIKNSCPILQSTFREVFRMHGFGLVPRRALEDHMLDNRYLIKKGGTVFTPYRVQHHDPTNWGDNQAEFKYKRFLKGSDLTRHDPTALRGFGYGAHLCPGRHFASAEILLFTALVILRFDAQPACGHWLQPSANNASQIAAVDQPDHDLEVELRPRAGVSQENWIVQFSRSERTYEDKFDASDTIG